MVTHGVMRSVNGTAAGTGHHFGEVFRHTCGRMVLRYFVPLLLLAVFFHVQYGRLLRESHRAHLAVIAEHQANTLDLFLRERLVNLANIIDHPEFATRAVDEGMLRGQLEHLQQTNAAFVDLGVVGGGGELQTYVGPVRFPNEVNYQSEGWFQELLAGDRRSIMTEVYTGFRGRPHFTVAVKRSRDGSVQVLRSTLSPERLSEYLTTLEGASEVHAAVVNGSGVLQITTPRAGDPLQDSRFAPPADPTRGYVPGDGTQASVDYAYAWLSETPWALVVTTARAPGIANEFTLPGGVFVATVVFFVLMGAVVVMRARYLVGKQIAAEHLEAELSGQLVHAAKLASVGELAGGIAHEINNPLAIIAETVGVLKDSMDPDLVEADDEPIDLEESLDIINEAVFRCRDITRKLLMFVRQTEVSLEPHYIHEILDEIVDGMLGNELAMANIQVVRSYDRQMPRIVTDKNQLIQVFLNLIKNSLDAMAEGGKLTVATRHKDDLAEISVKDTGCGMSAEQIQKVFMPFFTTKDPGKGTGLGLSVSYSIIETLGGTCRVESALGKGSTFTVELPYENK